MEHTGIIEEAGFKPKKDPSKGNNFCMKVSGWERYYYINKKEDKHLQLSAEELMGKTVKVTWEQNGEYRNVSAIEEVAPALNAPSTDNTMSKEDWALKDRRNHRLEIAKSCIEVIRDTKLTAEDMIKFADFWFYWVYETPQNPATKPQEGKPSKSWTKEQVAQIAQDVHGPSIATADKPAVAAAQGLKSRTALSMEVSNLGLALNWSRDRLHAEAVALANREEWENGELIKLNGSKEMDVGQLTHFVAFLKTEIAKVAK